MSGKGAAPRPLQERYLRAHGRVHLTGLQAVIRLPLEQVRRDRRDGRRTAALFSGYPGSPLAGLDLALRKLEPLLRERDVRLISGLNEELAASAIAGTQLLELFAHAHYDGVLGIWFGKAPGLDRALDALRHSNFTGTSRFGGALAVVGDDPFCKSSSLPSHSEHAFAHALMPLLAPSDPADVLKLGHHGIELSRYTGLWCGLRLVADVADSGAVFDLPPEPAIEHPKFERAGRPFAPRVDTGLLPPHVLEIEEELIYGRLEAARRYAWANGLNPITVRHANDSIGLVAGGALYRELESALALLGLDETELERLGVRLLKLEMLYPLEPRRMRDFAEGLDEIVVVDTRRGFIEEQIRSALYNETEHPLVLGQHGRGGDPWLARHESIHAATLALDLVEHLGARLDCADLAQRVAPLRRALERGGLPGAPARAPHFCSGCPHSASTRLPQGSLAGGGIGCHSMALLMDRNVTHIGAMGSEGAHWIGLEPYTETGHLFQNLGDGTYFHSGRLAIRACVAAGSHITYKLLYNGAVAMTGGQDAVGAKPLVALARDLLSDGVSCVVAMSDDPLLGALAQADERVRTVTREGWDAAMRSMREQPGVSVMIYDQLCANQLQRLERRGIVRRAAERVMINEDVCEGCGDCGVKSSCASLQPVQTPLGRKTRVHQSSCSDDRSCLDGDCPAFLGVEAQPAQRPRFESLLHAPLPQPERARAQDDRYEIFMVGIGSTGVVTIDALLVRAAELDGLHAAHLDQTGLAQRGGKVVAHCVIGEKPIKGSARVSHGCADVLLAFDPLGAVDADAERVLDPARTRAVMHDHLAPTGEQVGDPGFRPGSTDPFVERIRQATQLVVSLPAETLADAALDEVMCANLVLLGSALQLGLLPVSLESLEQAIRDNGVAVELNLRALALGRAVIVQPELTRRLISDAVAPAVGAPAVPDADARDEARQKLHAAWEKLHAAFARFESGEATDELERRIAGFALDLRSYQSRRYAQRYLAKLRRVAETEAAIDPTSHALTEIAARELYRVMAYKDEYEVARLLLRGPHRRWLARRSRGALKLRYHLHPPLLRAFGLKHKLGFGRWIEPLFVLLAALKRVRGTWLDPMHFLAARRLDRELLCWYGGVLEHLAAHATSRNLADAIEIAAMAEQIRGFEGVKAERAARVRAVLDARLAALDTSPPEPPPTPPAEAPPAAVEPPSLPG